MRRLYHYFLAILSYWFYGRPSRKLVVVGVTGTKGKSTTCRLIASVLEAGGYRVGLLSTAEFQIGEKRWLNIRKMTMLGRGEIHKMLKEMVSARCQYAVVETSSEGILQYRHLGLNYDIAVFTNLGTEHSERHGGFDNLKKAKGRMFAQLSKHSKIINGQKIKKVIVANGDDENAQYYLDFKADEKLVLQLNKQTIDNSKQDSLGTLGVTCYVLRDTGSEFDLENKKYTVNLPGKFNIYNALSALAVGKSQNISDEKIALGLAKVDLVPGRMEFINEGQNFKVIVDYAHEPLSLTELFTTLRNMLAPGAKLIGVVGSDGGGRDVGKRAKMGEIAGRFCDTVVITDVNCFDEDPKEIAEMLAVGARAAGKKDNENLFIEIDRKEGIKKAIALAKEKDIVVITAKGTEPCIVDHGKKIPWDDRVVAREIIREQKN